MDKTNIRVKTLKCRFNRVDLQYTKQQSMTAKHFYTILYRGLIICFITSYLLRSFILWNWDISSWSVQDRMGFVAVYALALLLHTGLSIAIQSFENDRLEEIAAKAKREREQEERLEELKRAGYRP
jgi:predicted acyltransferase